MDSIKEAGERARLRKALGLTGNHIGVPILSPEHYHIGYQIKGEQDIVLDWKEVYTRQRDAYRRVKEIGDEGEPNTEWYDNGQVMTEMKLRGHPQTFRVILTVLPCIKYHPQETQK